MSDTPPDIDAILASIRSRMTDAEDGGAQHEDASPEPAQPPAAANTPDIGAASVPAGLTLEALIRSMLEPMLQNWLDANMPEIVERLAQAEIKRLTGKD